MKVLLVPLDERPCNYKYPLMHSKNSLTLKIIPKDILPNKKTPGNVLKIWDYIFENISSLDGIILSLETVIYGGLLPSRLHYKELEELNEYVNNIKKIKEINSSIKIFASSSVMRTPTYNSSEEEPDYYADYGEKISRYGVLKDKSERFSLTNEEKEELLKTDIPKDIIEDYEKRRGINKKVTEKVLSLVDENIIDYLLIPQDDSSPFGYTAIDQKDIRKIITDKKLYFKTQMHPGSDESACTLLSKIYNELMGIKPKVYVKYSSTNGMNMIPKYEDRPFGESLKSHIIAQGGIITENINDSDYVLMVNIPALVMCESFEFKDRDISYNSYRNLLEFVIFIENNIDKNIVIADVAYSNGGDPELIQMLSEKNLLGKIKAYAGWNTACNTLGSVLNMAFLPSDKLTNSKNIIHRLTEDFAYQTIVRQSVINSILPKYGASYYDFNGKNEDIHEDTRILLQEIMDNLFLSNFETRFKVCNVSMPWKRMFEIDFDILEE